MAKTLRSDEDKPRLLCRCGGKIETQGIASGGKKPKMIAECTKCGATARRPSDLFARR